VKAKIWRVEDSGGAGPYRLTLGSDFRDDLDDRHSGDGVHPCPQNDDGIGRRVRSDEICGFNSIQQVKRWFTRDELTGLYAEGFLLKQIEVQKITAVSECQVLAVR